MLRFGPWEELWEDKALKIQKESPYGHYESYQLRPIIVKGGDDLRQEVMAMQVIYKMQHIFEKYELPIYLRPYEIIVTSANSGILEFCCDTLSVDGLKKKMPQFKNIVEIYKSVFGPGFEEAQKNFIESLAGYSLFSYLL